MIVAMKRMFGLASSPRWRTESKPSRKPGRYSTTAVTCQTLLTWTCGLGHTVVGSEVICLDGVSLEVSPSSFLNNTHSILPSDHISFTGMEYAMVGLRYNDTGGIPYQPFCDGDCGHFIASRGVGVKLTSSTMYIIAFQDEPLKWRLWD